VTQGILGVLAPRLRVPPSSGRLAVVSCTPGELHALGAQMVADFLEGEGWEVLALGAATPAADLAELVDDEQPDMVAISTAVADNLDAAAEMLARLRQLDDPPFIAAGGRAWTALPAERRSELRVDAVFETPPELCALLPESFPPTADARE
jgi:methanogenic corrinoid protein MtbC1